MLVKWATKVITLTVLVTSYVLVLATITLSHLNPEKTVLIATNLSGESLFEFLVSWFTVPFVIYNLKDFFASFFSRAQEMREAN